MCNNLSQNSSKPMGIDSHFWIQILKLVINPDRKIRNLKSVNQVYMFTINFLLPLLDLLTSPTRQVYLTCCSFAKLCPLKTLRLYSTSFQSRFGQILPTARTLPITIRINSAYSEEPYQSRLRQTPPTEQKTPPTAETPQKSLPVGAKTWTG